MLSPDHPALQGEQAPRHRHWIMSHVSVMSNGTVWMQCVNPLTTGCSGNKQSLRSVMTLCMREIGQYWVHAGSCRVKYRRRDSWLLVNYPEIDVRPFDSRCGRNWSDLRSRGEDSTARRRLSLCGKNRIIHRDEDLEMLDFTWRWVIDTWIDELMADGED